MKVYTLNCFEYNINTGEFDMHCENIGVFILKEQAEKESEYHSSNYGEDLRYVIEEFEI